jgi:hypothetical protein
MFKEALALATAVVTSPVATWRVVVVMVFGGHVVWACGWLPGIPGFAMAGEVEEKVAQLDSRLGAIESKQDIALRIALADEICRLFELREQSRGNAPLFQTLNEAFNDRQEDYRNVNGARPYDVAQCSAPR